jgi:hypothetical protein
MTRSGPPRMKITLQPRTPLALPLSAEAVKKWQIPVSRFWTQGCNALV